MIEIPELSLVVLIGISGSGKSSFAAKHFARTEVLSSDFSAGSSPMTKTPRVRRRPPSRRCTSWRRSA